VIAKERIDKLLVELGLADSRNRAQALVMAGVVLADDRRVEKPSEKINISATVRLKGASLETKYVGRGGLKLEAALREFEIDPTGWDCIDIGASTGGFTDCLLQHGAKRIVAIDSGTNQLVWSLRNDARVEVRERTNARDLTPDDFDRTFDLAVMDVSFISVKKVIPAIIPLLKPAGMLVVLIKPQFEVGRSGVGKGGLVRDESLRQSTIALRARELAALGLELVGTYDSPVTGAEGNREAFALLRKPSSVNLPPAAGGTA